MAWRIKTKQDPIPTEVPVQVPIEPRPAPIQREAPVQEQEEIQPNVNELLDVIEGEMKRIYTMLEYLRRTV